MPPIDPMTLSEADYLRWERVGWLRALIADHRELRRQVDEYTPDVDGAPARDDDPDATAEALRECEALADELEAELPR